MRWIALLPLVLIPACSSPERTSTPPPARTPAAPVQKMVEQPQAAAPVQGQKVEPQTAAPSEGAPAYDFKVDTARRIENAKKELGPKITTAVVSDVFVVICPKGWQGKACDDSISLMRSSMVGFMNGRFGKKPAEAISVYLFGDKVGYESFCTQKFNAPCIAHFGFYSPGERYMVMNAGLGLGTLTHEIVHPLVESDFPNAPTWLNEGVASVFEQPQLPRPGEIHGGRQGQGATRQAVRDAGHDVPRRMGRPELRDRTLRLPVARREGKALALLPEVARRLRERSDGREVVYRSDGNDALGGERCMDEVDIGSVM